MTTVQTGSPAEQPDLSASAVPTSRLLAWLQAGGLDEKRLEGLHSQDNAFWAELAAQLAPQLPPAEILLVLPGGEPLAGALAAHLKLPFQVLHHASGAPDHWVLPDAPLPSFGLLVTTYLTTGVPEMELSVLAQRAGCELRTVVCAVERSTAGGRHRLLQLGVNTLAGQRIAETPRGLILERRRAETRAF
ncbi:hypothetical protein [Deinococcus sonorensis]|uniref:Uncharacterized protein n=2 Tax=Deinococcus sonorensis TaxID=309891 RepID=A0AAU7UB16_9DEIO